MKAHILVRTLVLVTIALFTAQVHAIGGAIAVGLNEANQVDAVKVSFVADATIEADEVSATERIYYVPGKLRDETQVDGQKMIFIQRYDLGKLWMLMSQNIYIETDMSQPSKQMEQYQLVEREVLGRETVNGMNTTKYKVAYKSSKGKYSGFTWFTDDFIAVKSSLTSEENGEKQTLRFEITNLMRGPQDIRLFELPAGATKMNLPGMGGMQIPGSGDSGSDSNSDSDSDSDAAKGIEDAAKGIGNAAKDSAQEAAEQETRDAVTEGVSRFFKDLFNR